MDDNENKTLGREMTNRVESLPSRPEPLGLPQATAYALGAQSDPAFFDPTPPFLESTPHAPLGRLVGAAAFWFENHPC